MNFLPVDMTAVVEYGFDRWCRDAAWPVSEAEFRALGLAGIRAVDTAGTRVDEVWSDCIWSDLRFAGFVVQRIHALAVVSRLPRGLASIRAVADAQSAYLPDYDAMAASFRQQLTPLDRGGIWLRSVRRRWLGNRHVPAGRRLASALTGTSTWSIGAANVLKDAFLALGGIAADIRNPAEIPLARSRVTVPQKVRDALEQAILHMANAIAGLTLPAAETDAIVDAWGARLAELRAYHDAVSRFRKAPANLLWGSSGNSLSRIVAHALRRRGTRVIGVQHGHNPVWVRHPYMAYTDTRGTDMFLCGTPGQAAAYHNMAVQSGISRTAETEFRSLDICLYEKWRQNALPRRAVKTVVLAGFPGVASRYIYDWTGFSLLRVPLETKVATALRAAGYKVIYKPHPETASSMAKIMAPYVDEVSTHAFEDVAASADAAVYLYPFSTTLPYVLLHGLPVLIVDVAGRDWLPEVIDLLRRRCAVVTASLDDAGRISIESEAIVAGMRQAETQRDEDFANRLFSVPAAPLH